VTECYYYYYLCAIQLVLGYQWRIITYIVALFHYNYLWKRSIYKQRVCAFEVLLNFYQGNLQARRINYVKVAYVNGNIITSTIIISRILKFRNDDAWFIKHVITNSLMEKSSFIQIRSGYIVMWVFRNKHGFPPSHYNLWNVSFYIGMSMNHKWRKLCLLIGIIWQYAANFV